MVQHGRNLTPIYTSYNFTRLQRICTFLFGHREANDACLAVSVGLRSDCIHKPRSRLHVRLFQLLPKTTTRVREIAKAAIFDVSHAHI